MQQLSIELTPENLWNKLKALDPLMPRDTAPSIEMLRQAYQENRQREDSQVVLKLFESALDNWTNEEIKEFLCRWLLEPPQSVEMEISSNEKRRQFLRQLYDFIFK